MNKIRFFDGGMGTMLQAAGLLGPGALPEPLNLTHPEEIAAIHQAYADAGAEFISTNTFGANRLKFDKDGELKAIVEAAVANARKAADQIVSEAIATRDELMDEAKKEAEKCLAAVQAEMDAKLADGKRKYIAVQDEMNEIVELINQAQIRFMASYKEVHKIVSAMPETMRELEDEEASRKKGDESTVAAQNNLQTGESEYEEDLDEEEEDFSEEEMKQMMNRQDEE